MAVKRADQLVDGDVITQPLNGMPASMCSGRVANTVAVDAGIQINLTNQDTVVVAEDDRFELED